MILKFMYAKHNVKQWNGTASSASKSNVWLSHYSMECFRFKIEKVNYNLVIKQG